MRLWSSLKHNLRCDYGLSVVEVTEETDEAYVAGGRGDAEDEAGEEAAGCCEPTHTIHHSFSPFTTISVRPSMCV